MAGSMALGMAGPLHALVVVPQTRNHTGFAGCAVLVAFVMESEPRRCGPDTAQRSDTLDGCHGAGQHLGYI